VEEGSMSARDPVRKAAYMSWVLVVGVGAYIICEAIRESFER
jgi:hypothetical protein